MSEHIDIWLVGNTGLRNPNRIQEGFSVFASSSFVGKLHGRENELGFMRLLDEKGIIQNEDGKDVSGSHARKWRLMFAKNGFIYPQVKKKDGQQEDLGKLDDITPFGRAFLNADTYAAVQECFLRAMSVEQFPMPDGEHYFSPLRWLLAIMLELEKRTGSSELSRIEFALWGHTTNPSYDLESVVDNILDLRQRRAAAPAKRAFDKKEIANRGENYDKKSDNFLDYSDMNMRYLRISGVLQRKGRGLMIVPTKHILAEKLAKATASTGPIIEQYRLLCSGAPLPTDNVDVAKTLLDDLMKQMKDIIPTVMQILPKVDSIVTSVNILLANPAIAQSLQNVEAVTGNLTVTTRRLNNLLATLEGSVPGMMTRTDSILHNANTLAKNLNQIDVAGTVARVDETLANVEKFTEQLNNNQGTLGLLMRDPALYNNLNSTMRSADSLLIDLKAHPKRYVHFSLFGRKDK